MFNLSTSAIWGRGSLRGVGFTADGRTLVTASYYGISLYILDSPNSIPKWVPFQRPIWFHSLSVSENGKYLLLESHWGNHVIQLANGRLLENPPMLNWVQSTTFTPDRSGNIVYSPAEPLEFHSSLTYDPENPPLESSIREVFHQETGELLYTLADKTIQLEFEERAKPLGCDLFTFGYCGNAYAPLALSPIRAGFSPAGGLLAVLYQPADLVSTANQYSLLRLYDTADGQLMTTLGSYQRPVESFAFSPDGSQILVGYVDGTIELLSLPNLDLTFNARHFQTPVQQLEFSGNGTHIVIQRSTEVEVRLIKDGRLLNRQSATAFAASPEENLLAIGTENGQLQLWDLDKNYQIYDLEAHSAEIYALAFSPDGEWLTSSGEDCFVRSWYTDTGQLSHIYQENTTNAYGEESTESRIFIYSLHYLPKPDHLLGFGSWSRIVSWDIKTGNTRYLIEPDPLDYYSGMITLNPHFPVTVTLDGKAGVMTIGEMQFQVETGELLGTVEPHHKGHWECSQTGLETLDGEVVIAPGIRDRDGQLCFLDADNGELLHVAELIPPEAAEHFWITNLDLSPDGTRLLVTLNEGLIIVYQITG